MVVSLASRFEEILARLEKEEKAGPYEHAADELSYYATRDSTIGLVSDAFRNNKSMWVRYGIMMGYEMMNPAGSTAYRTLSQHCREAILEDTLVGIADGEERIRLKSSEVLSHGEELMKGVNPELGERIVKGLLANSSRVSEGDVNLALGFVDYSGISKGTKKQALDFLVDKAVGGSVYAAESIDSIWSKDKKDKAAKDSIDKVAGHWLPKLDSGREKDVERALNIFSELECKAAADKVVELVKKGKRGSDYYNLINVLEKSGDEKNDRHEEAMLELMKNERGHYSISDMEIMGRKGGEKSLKILNGVMKNTKNYDERDIEAAQNAIKEIEKRMRGVSTEPAVKKLEDAARKKKVPA